MLFDYYSKKATWDLVPHKLYFPDQNPLWVSTRKGTGGFYRATADPPGIWRLRGPSRVDWSRPLLVPSCLHPSSSRLLPGSLGSHD